MFRKALVGILLFLAVAAGAAAQINVRGQILLPNGDLPSENVRFFLASDDGKVNEYRFTDSNGRFTLERLNGRISYTITVESDGSTHDTTSYNFIPQYEQMVRITLRPLTRKPKPAGITISSASGYRPNPQAVKAHEAAAREIKNQQFEAAEKHLREAVEADAKFPDALIDLGALLMQQKKFTEAEQFLRQALALDSKSVYALLNLGIALIRQNKFADAIPHLQEAVRLQDGLVPAHLNLGFALVETGQFVEAEPHLQRALKGVSADAVLAQMYIGQLYARTGKYEKSIAAFEAYLEKAPNAVNAAEVRSLIERMRKEISERKPSGLD